MNFEEFNVTLPPMTPEVVGKKTAYFMDLLAKCGYDGAEDPARLPKLAKFCAEYDAGREYRKLTRGLRLVGKTGRGKTFFFELFRKWFGVPIVSLPMAVADFARTGLSGFEDYRWMPVVIDDWGRETSSKYMGGDYPFFALLEQRMTAARQGVLTFFTTELEDSEIVARYGAAAASRINALADVIRLNGGDRR